MNISVVGTGYVGLVTGTCFAEMGNYVICVDVNEDKINKLNNGIIPIYEPGLERIVIENNKADRLIFSTDIKNALEKTDICFIAVGTPMGEDGSADLQYVLAVAEEIGKHITKHTYIINKSTVPVGTADKVRETVSRVLQERGADISFDVISNPEFLKEGAAVNDFMKPDRVVVGADNERALDVMRELYAPFTVNHERFIAMDVRSSEMTKYAANSMLATKISFMNEIANICELVGADVNKVRVGIGSDSRIGYSFIYPGCGYGGSCFPKDVQALVRTANKNGYEPKLLEAVEAVNYDQKKSIPRKIFKKFGEDLSGMTFAVWGLSFKPETDDMRDAASITIVKELVAKGAKVKAYDPKAFHEAQTCYLKDVEGIEYLDSKYTALTGCDAMILVTEWKEFRSPDFDEIKKRLKNPVIFDGRNQYSSKKLHEMGFEYFQIGVMPK
ncbi:nucleotide sugar dehydrogenase [Denitrovibrio acetiphilus DSM 12809]|uniref:UDP-glucose 6-dehydrogenase n=1 Tax=Denitrovibrio acetiphilus (strain DSM 12809 / NBRC 114555 / N2460) TaxID=522772 RepID=D4H3U8_DENA2|nr:UDP-glucose/GDP-mannose dehydrogenase family protein [Denitrovibrio acetiphilus]ADD69200.1 nucleotide sugar dehydrogenase [Denitrovibrio acetiphilus DSM 12809]